VTLGYFFGSWERLPQRRAHRISRQKRYNSTSNLVGIIHVGVDACGILSRSVGQTNRKFGGHSAYKMQKSTENIAKSPKFCTLTGNRGRGIERQCLNLHQKFINNGFCACAVQMLLKMVVNATICSTSEVQYGKLTSSRTSAIKLLGYVKQIT